MVTAAASGRSPLSSLAPRCRWTTPSMRPSRGAAVGGGVGRWWWCGLGRRPSPWASVAPPKTWSSTAVEMAELGDSFLFSAVGTTVTPLCSCYPPPETIVIGVVGELGNGSVGLMLMRLLRLDSLAVAFGPHGSCILAPEAASLAAVGSHGSACACLNCLVAMRRLGGGGWGVVCGPHGSWILIPEAAATAAVGRHGSACVCLTRLVEMWPPSLLSVSAWRGLRGSAILCPNADAQAAVASAGITFGRLVWRRMVKCARCSAGGLRC